jgi:hypothetical protein
MGFGSRVTRSARLRMFDLSLLFFDSRRRKLELLDYCRFEMLFLLLQVLDKFLLQLLEVGHLFPLFLMFSCIFRLFLPVDAGEVIDDEIVAASFGNIGRRLYVVVHERG